MQRRTFLNSLAAVGISSFCLKSWATPLPQPLIGLLPPGQLPPGLPIHTLPKLINEAAKPGEFIGKLVASPTYKPLFTGAPTSFWTYNGGLPGPLIEVFEGDKVEITLHNQLPQPTTIHWHGLPIPPEQDGNPQNAILPGQQITYRFTLPLGSAGTYWYHPHPHHLTAEQVFRGLAGPIIVRARNDPLSTIPERLLMVTDLKTDANGQIAHNDANDWMNGREGQFILVNAQQRPVLSFDPNGRERWRLWNACNARYLRLQLPGTKLILVGTDGGLLERPVEGLTEYLLAPGQRVELIIEAGARRDRAELIAAIYDRGKMGNVAPEKAHSLLLADFSHVVATPAAPLPKQLRRLSTLGTTQAKKRVVFSESMKGEEMLFMINGKQYDMKRIDLYSRLHEVELWEIINQADMDHPFHLHGTQFQVIERAFNGKVTPAPYLAWQDTVNLRPGETVRLKAVQDWPGLRMFHCHILEHEDMGMMGQLMVR